MRHYIAMDSLLLSSLTLGELNQLICVTISNLNDSVLDLILIRGLLRRAGKTCIKADLLVPR